MTRSEEQSTMYGEFAEWFHLLTPPHEYAVEAKFYGALLEESARIPVREVLELGSGGGNNASHMKSRFDLTLVDLSEEMLGLSRSLNPECEHVRGDMRTVRLERTFDGVFIHDAIMYMTSEDDLRAAVDTAFEHCKPGGAVVLGPDHVKEAFAPATDHGGSDDDTRGMRYLEWTWDPDPDDETFVTDYAFLFRDRDGTVRSVHDRHVCGLFPRAMWLRVLEDAGFAASRREGLPDETGEDVFVGVKPLTG